MREVAERYGTAYERALIAQRELPSWAIDGVDDDVAQRWPDDVRRALGHANADSCGIRRRGST